MLGITVVHRYPHCEFGPKMQVCTCPWTSPYQIYIFSIEPHYHHYIHIAHKDRVGSSLHFHEPLLCDYLYQVHLKTVFHRYYTSDISSCYHLLHFILKGTVYWNLPGHCQCVFVVSWHFSYISHIKGR